MLIINHQRLAYIGIVLSVVFGLDLMSACLWYQSIWRDNQKPSRVEVEVAVVFYGDTIKGHSIGSDTKRRLNHVLFLFEQQKVQNIICVGGSKISSNFKGSNMMKKYLVKRGIPEHVVWADQSSYDTSSNWQEALKIMKANGWKEALAVSSAVHLKRIMKMIDLTKRKVIPSSYSYQTCKVSHLFRELKFGNKFIMNG